MIDSYITEGDFTISGSVLISFIQYKVSEYTFGMGWLSVCIIIRRLRRMVQK